MAESVFDQRIAAVRLFNRFYTRQIGVLAEGLLGSEWSLAEVRVLYEMAHRDGPTAAELCKALGLDAGYLSRILRGFESRGLVAKKPSADDGRTSLLFLTSEGRKEFSRLNKLANRDVRKMLERLSQVDQSRLVGAMHEIESILSPTPAPTTPYLLRPHRPGDMGWVVHRHGVLYAQEYGYDEQFEGLVAEIVARFIHRFDRQRESCWIAEKDGEIVGSVFLVKKSKTVAQLRLLVVEPKVRGLGIGKRLVQECVGAARRMGYTKIVLWTQRDLYAARNIYKKAGFRKVCEEPHHSFGRDLVAETWELKLW